MWFTQVSLRNPVFATMVMLALVVLGLFSFQSLKVDQFPNIDLPVVVVTTEYPGASPEIVESEVSKKIEEAVNSISGINALTSRSYEGLSVVIVEFDLTTNGRKAADEVREKTSNVPAARRRDEVKDCLALVGLDEAAWGRRTGGYSKGMRQRTGLAAALLGAPDLLVLDEPTDGIDPLGRRQVRDVILEVARRGATIFLNSHLLAETERVCDHVAVLHKGRVVRAGALGTLQRRDAFRVVFARISFANGPDAAARAATAGFAPAPDGGDADRERLTTSFQGTDAAALSAALQRALLAGLIVIEVAAELVELEAILEQSTQAPPQETP
jgi:energy-coupling factor transporter ATP-binding protein EcfA2